MMGTQEAKTVAEGLLGDELPRRWAHTQGVAARARLLAGVLGERAELVEAAAWLHDVEYSRVVRSTGFHPLDGARYLRDVLLADDEGCRLVAHHTGALVEADERGISDLADDFPLPDRELLEALTYCDLTAGADGCQVTVEERLSEILMRYPSEHVVHRPIVRSGPSLRRAAFNVQRRLGG